MCICGHAEEDHRNGRECEVSDCSCALYEAEEHVWAEDDDEEEDAP